MAIKSESRNGRFDLRDIDPTITERTQDQLRKQTDMQGALLEYARSHLIDVAAIESIAASADTDRWLVDNAIDNLAVSGQLRFIGTGYVLAEGDLRSNESTQRP